MDISKIIYTLAYGMPLIVIVLVSALIGLRIARKWHGAVLGAAIPCAIIVFGKAYLLAEGSRGGAASYQDASLALFIAICATALSFGFVDGLEELFVEALAKGHSRWRIIAAACTALILALCASSFAISWFYHRLFPFDQLNTSLLYWALIGMIVCMFGIDDEKSPTS